MNTKKLKWLPVVCLLTLSSLSSFAEGYRYYERNAPEIKQALLNGGSKLQLPMNSVRVNNLKCTFTTARCSMDDTQGRALPGVMGADARLIFTSVKKFLDGRTIPGITSTADSIAVNTLVCGDVMAQQGLIFTGCEMGKAY